MASKPPSAEPSTNDQKFLDLIKMLWAPIAGFLGAIFVVMQFIGYFQEEPNLLIDVMFFLLLAASLVAFFYIAFRGRKLAREKRMLYAILGFAVLLGALLLKIYSIRQTDYFILDASQYTGGQFQQIRARLNLILNSDSIPNNKDVGLAVFGGGTRGEHGCDDIEELVPPSPKEKSASEIQSIVDSLADIPPSGPGNIQGAVLFALGKLKSAPGVPNIIVITSGIDESCELLDRSAADQFAAENHIRFRLLFLTVGNNITDAELSRLSDYATDKIVITADNPDQVAAKIQGILNAPPASTNLYYLGNYGYVPPSNK